jgi:osmoprotectant transport system permease protein
VNVFGDAWDWFADGANWSGESGVWNRLTEHVVLTVVCVLTAVAIALPLALWLGHLGKGGSLAINISNIGRAIPTFAVLVLLGLSPIGMGDTATIIALVLFAIPPVLTNAYVGMRGVDRDVVEASRGMGMTGSQMLFRVELPLALPLIMTGIRTCAVQVVATATLAALVAGGGLGRIVTAGFDLQDNGQVVAGAILVAVLALVVEGLFALAQRFTARTPRGGVTS